MWCNLSTFGIYIIIIIISNSSSNSSSSSSSRRNSSIGSGELSVNSFPVPFSGSEQNT